MPKVEIDTPGVSIRLEASEASVGELSKQAIELYREANEVDRRRPMQMGFGGQIVERYGEEYV